MEYVINQATPPKGPIYNETEDETFYTCPECGKRLRSRGSTGYANVRGVPVEMDADWMECECGYVCND